MRGWFASLPIHQKLIAFVLAVSTAAVLAALSGLLAFDIARFRSSAFDETQALARVIARNSSGAVLFNDPDAARDILQSVEVKPSVSRACLYAATGSLFAAYRRPPAPPCPAVAEEARGWRTLAVVAPVSRSGRMVGTVYVERRLADLPGRIFVTAAAALVMLIVAGILAFALARRMQQLISRPIVALAGAARAIGRDRFELPEISAPPDETGELVRSFRDMVQRLASANAERDDLLRRERQASRLKDEFLAALSHELRTPLNAILGWTQILEATDPDPQMVAKAVASVSRNARAQSRVIEDLLDVSRIVTGKMQLSLAAVDVRATLQAAVDVIAPAASAKRIRVDVAVPPVPCIVQADPDRLRQVLWNLLSNAVKFTDAGGTVAASVVEGEREFSIAIADTGIGISAEFLPFVFERFRQADGSPTREHGGLGLGLAIVKDVVELHSGTVRAGSDGPGRGATFIVVLPRLVGAPEAAPPRATIAPLTRLDGVDVVAIDDNQDALEILGRVLVSAGAHVRAFSSPESALADIRRAPPFAVLCDIAMPEMDGFAVLAAIEALDRERGTTTPVLALTAYAAPADREKSRAAGFRAHIAKPYDAAELVRLIAAIRSPSSQST